MKEFVPFALRPSLALAAGALLASLTFAVGTSSSVLIALFFSAAIFAALLGLGDFIKFCVSFALVAISALAWRSSEAALSHLPCDCGVVATVEASDFSLPGEEVPWMKMPFYNYSRVKDLRFSRGYANPIPADFGVALVARDKKLRFSHGDILEVAGRLCRPSDALFDGDFSQRDFLLSRKISFLLYADDVKVTGRRESLSSGILYFRNMILSRICSGIRSEENRDILAALIFGCRQGIDSSTRQRLLMSGTVHVIAISGMHTAIFGLLVLSLLCVLPFRTRYILLPFIVLGYVFCTGFQPSAIRALLMISIWSFQRAALYPPNAFSSLFIAAAASLVLNPFSILDAGFQYSFLITGFLIGGWRKASCFVSLLNVRSFFMPGALRPGPVRAFFTGFVSTGIMCVVAFLSGLQISLFNQNIFNPLSVLVNLVVTPFLWVIFCLSFALSLVPVEPLSVVMDLVLSSFGALIMSFSDSAMRLASPPLFPFLLFFCLPLSTLVFLPLGRRSSFVLAVSVFISLSFCFMLPGIRGSRTYVLSGAGRPPVIVALRPGTGSAYVVNVPGVEHSRKIIEILASNGFSSIDGVYCAEALMAFSEGAPYLFSYFDCGNMVFLTNPAMSPYAKIASRKAGENLVKVWTREGTVKPARRWGSSDSDTRIKVSRGESVRIFRSRNGGSSVEMAGQGVDFSVNTENHLRMKVQMFPERRGL